MPLVPRKMTFSRARTNSAFPMDDLLFGHGGYQAEVELLEGLALGKAGLLQAVLEAMLPPGLDLRAKTGDEVGLVRFPVPRGLPGDLLEVALRPGILSS